MTTEQEVKVDLKGLCLDAELWKRFMQLPEIVRTGYLSRCINDSLENIFDDSELMGSTIQLYLKGGDSGIER